jgi:pimeloyl-ACP methyl ester carboxylesterase
LKPAWFREAQCLYDEDVFIRRCCALVFWIIAIPVIALLICGIFLQLICTHIDRRKFPAPGELVETSFGKMHVCRFGSGSPPVVLEAGIASSTINWRPLQAELAKVAATYSYDRAGFGWSVARRRRRCSLCRLADDLHATVQALGIAEPFILVGHSFAAYIMRVYASRFPENVAGLIMVDPLTPEEWISPTSGQRWVLRGGIWFSRAGGVLASLGVVRLCLWSLQRGKSRTPKAVLAAFGPRATETVGRILTEVLKLPAHSVRVIRARWSTPRFFWTMADYIKSLPSCAAELQKYSLPAQIPVTVISGAHQPHLRLQEHVAIAEQSIRGRHMVAERSRHWIHLDEPEVVIQAVRDMLEFVRNSAMAGARNS